MLDDVHATFLISVIKIIYNVDVKIMFFLKRLQRSDAMDVTNVIKSSLPTMI